VNLPAGRVVIGGHRGHALQRERLAYQIRALIFLHRGGRESPTAIYFALYTYRLDRLDLLDSALGLNVLVDEFFGALCLGQNAQA
jgi:hypothetical protein